MGCLYLGFNKLIQQNPHVSKQQILNSVGEDEDLPDLHDEDDERIHLTPNGIVPLLFVWKMLEKTHSGEKNGLQKVEKCNAMYWMRCLFVFSTQFQFFNSTLCMSLSMASQAVTPWHFVERAPELSGLPFAEDMMKPWKSTGSS